MIGAGAPAAERVPPWARPMTRNIARAILVVACVTGGISTVVLLSWYKDEDTSRSTAWGPNGVTFLPNVTHPWEMASVIFCAYADETKSENFDPAGSELYTYYPTGGSIDIPALCVSLRNMITYSLMCTWLTIVSLSCWAVVAVMLSIGSPWKLEDRLVVLSLLIATIVLSTLPVIAWSIWQAMFHLQILATGVKASPYLGAYLGLSFSIICFLAIPPAVLDLLFVQGYESLSRYKWSDCDPLEQQRIDAAAAAAAFHAVPQFFYPALTPMGNLYRPGETPNTPYAAAPLQAAPERILYIDQSTHYDRSQRVGYGL